MPRQSRLDAPGVMNHIMIRGIERRKIFVNNRDREGFLERFWKLLHQTETACYAWVFIPLIRSVGGWAGVKQLKRQGHDHVMSDERILGDSAFVENLLSEADESYERRYELHRLGYDADRTAKTVAEIYDTDPLEFLSKGKQQLR